MGIWKRFEEMCVAKARLEMDKLRLEGLLRARDERIQRLREGLARAEAQRVAEKPVLVHTGNPPVEGMTGNIRPGKIVAVGEEPAIVPVEATCLTQTGQRALEQARTDLAEMANRVQERDRKVGELTTEVQGLRAALQHAQEGRKAAQEMVDHLQVNAADRPSDETLAAMWDGMVEIAGEMTARLWWTTLEGEVMDLRRNLAAATDRGSLQRQMMDACKRHVELMDAIGCAVEDDPLAKAAALIAERDEAKQELAEVRDALGQGPQAELPVVARAVRDERNRLMREMEEADKLLEGLGGTVVERIGKLRAEVRDWRLASEMNAKLKPDLMSATDRQRQKLGFTDAGGPDQPEFKGDFAWCRVSPENGLPNMDWNTFPAWKDDPVAARDDGRQDSNGPFFVRWDEPGRLCRYQLVDGDWQSGWYAMAVECMAERDRAGLDDIAETGEAS